MPLRKRPVAFGLIGGMWGIASVAGRKFKPSENFFYPGAFGGQKLLLRSWDRWVPQLLKLLNFN